MEINLDDFDDRHIHDLNLYLMYIIFKDKYIHDLWPGYITMFLNWSTRIMYWHYGFIGKLNDGWVPYYKRL